MKRIACGKLLQDVPPHWHDPYTLRNGRNQQQNLMSNSILQFITSKSCMFILTPQQHGQNNHLMAIRTPTLYTPVLYSFAWPHAALCLCGHKGLYRNLLAATPFLFSDITAKPSDF
jgi:hypothetical protein